MSQKKKKPITAEQYKKKKRLAISIFACFMALIVAAGVLAVKVLADVDTTMNRVYQEVSTINMRTSEDIPEEEQGERIDFKPEDDTTMQELMAEAKPMAILLIGTDTGGLGRTAERGLSDTLIYCVLNPQNEKLTLLSIPRDSWVEIVGYGTWTKINAAYAYGGAEMTINTVQNLLGLPVDAYAVINFGGFERIIDAMGGITVDNAFAFSQDEYYFPEGTLTLDGEEALAWVRMRYNDPEGDFGRSRRQRQMVVEVARKATSMASALNYAEILKAVGDNVLTNVNLDSALTLMAQYSRCLNNIESMDTLVGTGVSDNGWYYVLDQYNLSLVTQQLREELELD